ncbi:MAG: TetR/AcrR family transcriptional regulator [Actinomycetota bacterium]|nr:TetR/AcrR family transcriptional regulator [Actinomycetota bacterium]
MSSDAGSGEYGDPQTRERLLRVTQEVLVERGRGLRLAEVAERAGVSRQALYLHFGDRRGLILALVRRLDEELALADRLEHVQAAKDGAEMLTRTLRLNTEFWAQVAPIAAILSRSKGEDEALHAAWRDRMSYRRAAFGRIAKSLEERGELHPEWSVEETAELLFAITHFDSWLESSQELGWSDDHYVGTMSRLLERSLLA